MAASFEVRIRDEATPALKRLTEVLGPRPVNAEIAAACAQLTKRHLIQKNQEPNKAGWPKQGFYGKAAEKISWAADAAKAVVTIAMEGFAQRFFGGTIRAVKAKALTIPLVPEAYGKRAREFKDLVFVRQKAGRSVGLLMKKGTDGRLGTAMFLLVKSVTQAPDPSVIPTEAEYNSAMVRAVDSRYRRFIKGATA